MVGRLLASRPEGVNSVDYKCLLRARRLSLRAVTESVERCEHLIKLGDLGRVPVSRADAVSILFLHKTEKNRGKAEVQISQERNG